MAVVEEAQVDLEVDSGVDPDEVEHLEVTVELHFENLVQPNNEGSWVF